MIQEFQFYGNFIISFLIASGYSIYKDYKNSKNYSEKKIQEFTIDEIKKTYKKVTPLVLTNLFISSLPSSLLFYHILPDNVFNFNNFNYIYCVVNFYVLRILTDLFFYTCHRIFHTKYFYKYHKVHHEIKAPIGISAIYAHPIDFYFGNIFPIFLPCYLFYTNVIMIHIWIFLTTWNTVNVSHSGYLGNSEFHDIHHKYFKYNYGTDYFMDNLFGTKK